MLNTLTLTIFLFNRILPRGIWEIYNIFNFKKVPKLASFQVKLVNFPSEKGRFGFCYDRYTSAVIG